MSKEGMKKEGVKAGIDNKRRRQRGERGVRALNAVDAEREETGARRERSTGVRVGKE